MLAELSALHQTDVHVFASSSEDRHQMDLMTSSPAGSGSYVTMTKEQVRRLARQLPPHDSDARHCHGPLSDDDKRRLDEFRDSRYRDALGQGVIHQLDRKTVCRQVRVGIPLKLEGYRLPAPGLQILQTRVTGQLADCQLADWISRGLVNSRTRQVADYMDNSRSRRCRQKNEN